MNLKSLSYLLLLPLHLLGQFGNDWINYNQEYFQLPVYQTGVYRISYDEIKALGVNINSIDPRNIQVFGREAQQPLYIFGESDGSLNQGDFIEFYAEKNDGWLDSLLYEEPSKMGNAHFSLFNDTIYYYLTFASTPGQRMTQGNSDNVEDFNPIPYLWVKEIKPFHEYYQQGVLADGLSSSKYSSGEGWCSRDYSISSVHRFGAFDVSKAYIGSNQPLATMKIRVSGGSDPPYSPALGGNHHAQLLINAVGAKDTIFKGYDIVELAASFGPPFDYQNTGICYGKAVQLNDLGLITDKQHLHFVTLDYPRKPDLDGDSELQFYLEASAVNATRVDVQDFSGSEPILYNVVGHRITGKATSNVLSFLVPTTLDQTTNCFLFDAAKAKSFDRIHPVNGNGKFIDFSQQQVDSAYLIITHEKLLSSSAEYANYRSSPEGGQHNTLTVNIEQLYHQFGGGIPKNELAIQRFANYTLNKWSRPPQYLFLIGKGIRSATESNNGTWHGTRLDTSAYENSLVPSFGYPPSDYMLSSGLLDQKSLTPLIATGRLAAQTNEQVRDYLDKIKTYEINQISTIPYNIADKLWQKTILHFGGGANQNEQERFESYLEEFETIAADTSFGAMVHTYLKTSSAPFDPIDFNQINKHLQDGVSIITLFGHASLSGFDQNLDVPSNWKNEGKYPFVIGNGCYSGNIFENSDLSLSEDFVILPKGGAIGFLANVKLGYELPLYQFTSRFYQQFSSKSYGESIGKNIRNTIESITTPYQNSQVPVELESTLLGMILHGDPALKINSHSRPEYVLESSTIFIKPQNITLDADSITVGIVPHNLGRATNNTIPLEVIRTKPSGEETTIAKSVSKLLNHDTLYVKIPADHTGSRGVNKITAKIDIPSAVPEQQDEFFNNQTTKSFVVNGIGFSPIYPYNFAIIGHDSVQLKISTLNPFQDSNTYVFQIDSTDKFNSPMLREQVVVGGGGVVSTSQNKWMNASNQLPDPLTLEDSTVYFWRVSIDSNAKNWEERSFHYIPGKWGWSQAHFQQFKQNSFIRAKHNANIGKFELSSDVYKISAFTNSHPWNHGSSGEIKWLIGSDLQDYGTSTGKAPAIMIAVVDPVSLEGWQTGLIENVNGIEDTVHLPTEKAMNSLNIWGAGKHRDRPDKYFMYRISNPGDFAALENALKNVIPVGHYVIIYSFNGADYGQWQTTYPQIFDVFQSLGAKDISPSQPADDFILFYQNGNIASFQEKHTGPLSQNINEEISLSADLTGVTTGIMTTPTIGPAKTWNSIHWKQHSADHTDTVQLQILGISQQGAEKVLFDTVFTPNDSLINLDQLVDANVYPQIKCRALMEDQVFGTPAQIKKWQILFTPIPEFALNPQASFYYNGPKIQQGATASLAIAVENISDFDADSILIKYWLENKLVGESIIDYPKQAPLKANGVILDTININTKSLAGHHSLWMEANPIIEVNQSDQPEQYHFNNFGHLKLQVNPDAANPILDVAFDGFRIMNGELVSAKPLITVSLLDENPHLLLNKDSDTTHLTLSIRKPNSFVFQRIPYRGNNGRIIMNWIPASPAENKFSVEYPATFDDDGIYTLKVQGHDKSFNESGDFDYEVDFEVINKSTITHLVNYPNPFSTRTQFVFTLTGSEIPTSIRIQILTVSGKVVREISEKELGPIKIGHNRTEFHWDGRDQFGDRLANGIYLYRVLSQISGKNVEHRQSKADLFFQHSFGKMYLIR